MDALNFTIWMLKPPPLFICDYLTLENLTLGLIFRELESLPWNLDYPKIYTFPLLFRFIYQAYDVMKINSNSSVCDMCETSTHNFTYQLLSVNNISINLYCRHFLLCVIYYCTTCWLKWATWLSCITRLIFRHHLMFGWLSILH